MTILDDTGYYMNPVSGSVQRGSEWLDDQDHEGWPSSELGYLIRVFWSAVNQTWVEG
jgi:hypothetical protein